MSTLNRIKKKQELGFKQFVINLESSSGEKQQTIIQNAILEDPNFMMWVVKNIVNVDDLLALEPEELQLVFSSLPQPEVFLHRAFGNSESMNFLKTEVLPEHLKRAVDDEISLKSGTVLPHEKVSAQNYILGKMRSLQMEGRIRGVSWSIPPFSYFETAKNYPDGAYTEVFEHRKEIVAAEGEYLKNKRAGIWKHYYENGKLMAQGPYHLNMKHGDWKFWYANGKLKSRGSYHEDMRDGRWYYWDREGNEETISFSDGKKESASAPV